MPLTKTALAPKPLARVAEKAGANDSPAYIKVLPRDIEPGDVIDPEDDGVNVIVTSVQPLDTGSILVKSEIGAFKWERKYNLSTQMAQIVGGNKIIAYRRNHALAPRNGAGHPLWLGYEKAQAAS